MVKKRKETLFVSEIPPIEDSQPIPFVWLDKELQLAQKGSPYFTTPLVGLISSSQEELTGFPKNTQYEKSVFYAEFT